MEYGSSFGSYGSAAAAAPRRKRQHARQRIPNLAYVNLDRANGGIIRDLSETGVAIQAVAPLQVNQQVYLRFELFGPRVRVEGTARVAWANSSGQAGVEFLALPQRSQRMIKEWFFTQLLTMAHQTAWDSIFTEKKENEEAAELRFSAAPHPAIRLRSEDTSLPEPKEPDRASPQRLRLAGYSMPMSTRVLTPMVDALILLSAVTLFLLVSLAMTHVFPSWPLGAGVTVLFAGLYRCMFMWRIGATPGAHFAQLAVGDAGEMHSEEELPRFR